MLSLLLIAAGTITGDKISTFNITESEEGILIKENGKKVLFYQKEIKSHDGMYPRNNYIHPLYNLDGDTLTVDFPDDHLFHRGIFWAWHHVSINNQIVGDPWILKDYNCTIISADAVKNDSSAVIALETLWSSPEYSNNTPYLREQTQIKVYSQKENIRVIDFTISLSALVDGVKLGGTQNEKGYGGFCTRIKTPDDLVFTSSDGRVNPQEFQLNVGPYMDFSGSFGDNISGLTLLCHPLNPGYPQPWILRQKRSMQNVVYPGQNPVGISTESPIVLRYRIIIHKDVPDSGSMKKWMNDYGSLKFNQVFN